MEKETIELVKKMIEDGNLSQEIAEKYCPELKENEDERIRKALIDGFTVMKESKNCGKTFSNHNIPVADILAWLEKQGNNMGISEATKQKLEDNLNKALEKETPESCNKFLDKQGKKISDKIIEKAKTEKQRILLTETDGSANIDWDCRSLDDVKILLKCGLEFIRTIEANKQILTDNRFGGCYFRVPTRYDKGIKQGEQKPATWSKEDEHIYQSIIDDTVQENQLDTKQIDWLKSLRPKKPLTNEEIEQAKKEYREVALSKMDYIPGELTYDNGWDDAISYIEKVFKILDLTGSRVNENG